MPENPRYPSYQTRLERRKDATQARREATAAAADAFIRDVPALINSKIRTRLFIAMCEHGPIRSRDMAAAVARVSPASRKHALDYLVRMGIAGRLQDGLRDPVYYLNPGHPAHAELRAFGLRLAQEWPSPPRPVLDVPQTPVPLTETPACDLFRKESGNRALLFIAATGGATEREVYKVGVLDTFQNAGHALDHFVSAGFLLRDDPKGPGAGHGRPKRYRLDPAFFAAEELRALLFALVVAVHDDILGLACAFARSRPAVTTHLEALKAATNHLGIEWTVS